jgi:outer membrane immunogenic protein
MLIRGTLVSSVALTALTQMSLAADLPNRKEPLPVFAAIAPTWTGFYVGANVGGVWGRSDIIDTAGTYFFPNGASRISRSGVIGGVQAGYNWQISNIVLGVEADVSFSSSSQSAASDQTGLPGTHSSRLSALGTVRARAGLAFDRFMPYVTGGLAFADLKNSLTDPKFPFTTNRGSTSTGWVVGAGVEYALTQHWTVKAEYLYASFRDRQTVANVGPYNFKFKDSLQIARAGINYKF